MAASFDKLIQEIGTRYCIGPKACPLVQETLGLINAGFLDRFKAAGFAAEVASWGGTEIVPLSGQEVEETLGSDVISEIANKAGVSQSFAGTIMGYAIPKIIVLLAQDEAVPSAIPASASSFLDSAIPLSSSPVEKITQPGAEQIRPNRTEQFGAAPRTVPPRFERLVAYGSRAALAVCLFGFAWVAGAYFSGGQSPFYAIKPPPTRTAVLQESAERTETQTADDIRALKASVDALRAAQSQSQIDTTALEGLKTRLDAESSEPTETQTADDIRALKASVDALRAAQSQSQIDATALEGLKTRLDYVKSETAASIAEVAGKIEQMQREPAAKLSQVIERLDHIEHQIATPLATASLGATSAPGKAAARKQAQVAVAPAKPPLEYARGQRNIGRRGDAFDSSQNPTAPGAPRPLGSLAPVQSTPKLITNWVVRDVHDGIALVEGPRGSIEVAPGKIIPGAGTVESIERRGGGWIVITSRGLIEP